MSNTPRMGRGLDALFVGTQHNEDKPESLPSTLDLNTIFPNPNQPRKHFNNESLEELTESIRQQGIIQPLLVRPMADGENYELIAGERRYRAAKMAGLNQVPVYIRNFDDTEVMSAALIENIQRENLSPIEEANALKSLRDECGITQEELAAKLGKSRSAITNTLRLLQLSVNAQGDLQKGIISSGHARAILSLAPDPFAQEELRIAIIKHGLSVRDTEAAVQCYKDDSTFPWSIESKEQQNVVDDVPQNNEPKKSSRTKPVYLQELQKKINDKVQLKTSISGSEERGRLTLTYNNTEELEKILELIGINDK